MEISNRSLAELQSNVFALLKEEKYTQALALSVEAQTQAPKDKRIFFIQMEILYQSKQFDSLIVKTKENIELIEKNSRMVSLLANAFRYTDRAPEAITLIKNVLKNDPGALQKNSQFLINQLGLIYKDIGDKKNAIISFQNCLAQYPNFFECYWNKLSCGDSLTDDELEKLKSNFNNTELSPQERVFISYSLFYYYDRCSQYSIAFEYLSFGAKLKRQHIRYDHQSDCEEYANIISTFNKNDFTRTIDRNLANCPIQKLASTPIFIVGMPRSGTSLIEQIVSSHSLVTAGDETFDLQKTIGSILVTDDAEKKTIQWLEHIISREHSEIVKKYMQFSSSLHKTAYFTDKTLINFKLIGLIRLVFPTAKIIHCQRETNDNIFSCFKQIFSDGFLFTYDLEELKNIFFEYERLMAHWHVLFGDSILRVEYEALVSHPNREIQKLLSYIGLKNEDACFNFFENTRSVFTLSAMQVKQPIYTTSVGAWKNYSQYMFN